MWIREVYASFYVHWIGENFNLWILLFLIYIVIFRQYNSNLKIAKFIYILIKKNLVFYYDFHVFFAAL